VVDGRGGVGRHEAPHDGRARQARRGVDREQQAVPALGQRARHRRAGGEAEVDGPEQQAVRARAVAGVDEVVHEGAGRRAVEVDEASGQEAADDEQPGRLRGAQQGEGRRGAGHPHREGLAPADPVGDHAARELTQEAPDARQRDDDADLRDRQVAVREVEREEGLDDAAQPIDERRPEERVERPREAPEARAKGRRRHRLEA
jgi:hypothetical protein